ncbi:MAG: hypothetical protein J1E78_07990 [Muribaculaceae bacterium]|nr:hypothetical protein [Muribaculaceae bacterium]
MKRIYPTIYILSTLWASLMMMACSNVSDPEQPGSEGSFGKAFLSLKMNSLQNSSRAGEELVDGDASENYIDFEGHDFEIILFDSSTGNYMTKIPGSALTKVIPNYNKGEYSIEVELSPENLESLPSDISAWNFRVLILANWNSAGVDYPTFDGKNISEAAESNIWNERTAEFSYNPSAAGVSWYPSPAQYPMRLIPMTGTATVSGFALDADRNVRNRESTAYMLRSLAKISLEVSDDLFSKGFDIAECAINIYNTTGLLIPDMTLTGNSGSQTGNFSINYPSCPDGVSTGSDLNFVNLGEEGGKNLWVAYIPEMNTEGFTTSSLDRPVIKALPSISGEAYGDWRTIDLIEKNTSAAGGEKNLYQILRNNYYKCVVKAIEGTVNIQFTYTVCPWKTGDVNIDYH